MKELTEYVMIICPSNVCMYTTCVWANTYNIYMLFENCAPCYVEVSLSTVISTMEATSVLLFQSEGSSSFLLTQKHAVVGLSGHAHLGISEQLMVGQWLVPPSEKQSSRSRVSAENPKLSVQRV